MADGLIRRTDDIMELLLDQRGSSTQSIRVQTSPDLTTWSTLVDIPAKQSPPSNGLGQNWRGKVFHKLVLSEYSLTVPLYVRFQDIDATVAVTTSDVHLLMESARGSYHFWMMTGTVPQGAALANSIAVNIPASTEFAVQNVDSTEALMVAFSENGPEKSLAAGAELGIEGRVQKIWLRGVGGATDFELRISAQY